MIKHLAPAIIALPALSATAQDISKGIPSTLSPKIINKCMAIKNDPERLRCFETITENSAFGKSIAPDDIIKIIRAEDAERGETPTTSLLRETPKQPVAPKPTVKKPTVPTPQTQEPTVQKPKAVKPTAPPPKKPTVEKPKTNLDSAVSALQKAENEAKKREQEKAKQQKNKPKTNPQNHPNNRGKNTNVSSDGKQSKTITVESTSSWEQGQGKHPVTNLPVTYLYTYALESLNTPDNQESKPYLMIRCHNKQLTAFINYPYFYMGKKPLNVAHVTDGQPPVVEQWLVSADTQSAGLFRHDLALDFIHPLYEKYHLEVATRPQNKGNPVTVNFDISGLKTAIEKVALYCPDVTAQ